jgi:putative transposase
MKHLAAPRGVPESITTDNGSEFAGQAMDIWAHQAGVQLDFIRPGRPALIRLTAESITRTSLTYNARKISE